MRSWPPIDVLRDHLPLPAGVSLRLFAPEELVALPTRWRRWYPTVHVGAESVFLDEGWLAEHVVTTHSLDRSVYLFAIDRDGSEVGMMSFLREPAAGTLHARLGLLDPDTRSGVLGALGFPTFLTLGRLVEAELLLVWVTLASRTQQFMARRNGFRLCGVVPGFDRDQVGERSARVYEALYSRLLVDDAEVLEPDADALLPETQALLDQILGRRAES